MPEPALDSQLISVLRCPVTGQPLRAGTEADLPEKLRTGRDAILITADGRAFYPVVNGILMLLPEQRTEIEERE